MKVFVSYSHAQSDWVRDRLVPCLEAGGAKVLIDWKLFTAGRTVVGQMDTTQDQAEKHLLVLSSEYLASPMCTHEMDRALALDPGFVRDIVVPVQRDDAAVPAAIKPSLYVDLRDDAHADQWKLLLQACGASLGAAAPDWLTARDDIVRFLDQGRSVNFVVPSGVRWREVIGNVRGNPSLKLAVVDLEDPAAAPRQGLIATILQELGVPRSVPLPPNDLPELSHGLNALGRARLALQHFDIVPHRPEYNIDLFAALRYLVMDKRQLVLLIHSRQPVASLLPVASPLSRIDFATIELRASP
jgi:hypothetical protein